MIKLKKIVAGALMAATAMTAGAATFVGDRTDFRDETIYFAMTTRFYDGDPTNNVLCWDGQADQIANGDPCWRGDFKGLIEKLPYIKALGFTAVWITPIVQNASGFDYHGYHASDFSQVDLRYKSKKEWGATEDVDFKDLIEAAHELDMKIVLDIVLQHTGNFGEEHLCKLFERNQNIRNQAKIEACLIPDEEKLGGKSYWDLDPGEEQYPKRFQYMKNTGGVNLDDKNYWHHVADQWNWDLPNRWWGQIAGDCVDLNTENPAVVEYIISCYEEFIKLGVDAFRIDTTGHIAPLTFNSSFIPKFIELGEKYKGARKGTTPFYMFGECCARYGQVIYRDQHVLSSHYYTWKSDPALISEWQSYTADWWANQVVPEGAAPLGNMLTCEKDPGTVHNSDNVFMLNGAWHEPDYSDASGFNVIDFPMHYNFNSAAQAVNIAKEGDHYYNDASWNVVYVDSHDYCPGPNDGTRFSGGTEQWAENLSLMFTFRGIPCIYYGSEVEFQKGVKIDEGPLLALANSGRAYFGEYVKGSVDVEDFAKFSNATGNMAETLNGDLSQHIIRLNQIRAAVPALRKGQYTFDDCEAAGGFAYKRAYKDSYALVALNGGATFNNVPAGTYVDLVTGKSYTPAGGSITVTAPGTPGQLRVLVKDWTGGKVGVDGKFIYDTTPVSHGGAVHFTDPGTDQYYTNDDVIGDPEVVFNPKGGSFKTETITVTASLNSTAVSGSFQINGGTTINLTAGESKQFTLGEGMNYGQIAKVTWTASNGTESYEGYANYKKVDPNAVTTIYVTGKDGADISGTRLYAWSGSVNLTGAWPGVELKDKVTVGGREFYYYTLDTSDPVNIILNRGNGQTGDITGVEGNVYFEYDGNAMANKIDVEEGPVKPVVRANPASGKSFTESLEVTLSVSPATDIFYTLDGTQASESSTKYTGPITLTQTTTINTYVKNEAGVNNQTFSYTKVEQGDLESGTVVYVTGKNGMDISGTYIHAWTTEGNLTGEWPGKKLEDTIEIGGKTFYYYAFPDTDLLNVIFNKGNGQAQTANLTGLSGKVYFEYDNGSNAEEISVTEEPQAPVVRANPASGTLFRESLSVTLTAFPATDIYYTLNGQPASASSMKYTGPITLTETSTINTYVVNEAGENHQAFTYTKSAVENPADNTKTVYFLNNENWGNVFAYCWDNNNSEANAFSGAWPGKELTETVVLSNVHPDVDGQPIYKFSFAYDDELDDPYIIFNTTARVQSENYKFMPNGIYRHGDPENSEPFAFYVTAVKGLKDMATVTVYSEGGKLVVEADSECVVEAIRLDGTVRELRLMPGYNYFEMPKGFYIVAGKKVII